MIALREKLTKLFSVFSLLVLLSLVPVCQAAKINVDGDPSDWTGIPPLVEDPIEDANEAAEDIVDCFCIDDCTHLCFLVTFVEGAPDMLVVYIDTDQNPTTGLPAGIGADCEILINLVSGDPTGLYVWDGSKMVWSADIVYAIGESSLEFCVPLADAGISQGSSINLFFFASMVPASDWAPDEGYVTYKVSKCPSEVGGEIFQIDKLAMLTPYFLVALAIATATSLVVKKRKL